MATVPNLWHLDEAGRLYQLFLCRLSMADRHEEIVSACAQIREYAASSQGVEHALFTFPWEVESLCELRRYDAAWRALRNRETIMFGHELDLNRGPSTPGFAYELAYRYAPVSYFRGEFEAGRSFLENGLKPTFDNRPPSYGILFHVFNGEDVPSGMYRVTLKHFYDRLNRDLCDWEYWEAFVEGFHPRLYELTGVSQNDIRHDAARFAEFFDRLMAIRERRTISGVTFGEDDLVQNEDEVLRRQRATERQLQAAHARLTVDIEAQFQQHFPDLAE